jgi:hypothetical protein
MAGMQIMQGAIICFARKKRSKALAALRAYSEIDNLQ